jgi:hypothetical protein
MLLTMASLHGRSKPIYIPELQPRRADPRPKIDPETGEVITPDPTRERKEKEPGYRTGGVGRG